jgi:hypothetical protein
VSNAFPQFATRGEGMAKQSLDVADESACCFCRKPVDRQESEQPTLKMSTTDGGAYLVAYHEHCFREWLENKEAVAPLAAQSSETPRAPWASIDERGRPLLPLRRIPARTLRDTSEGK